MVVERIFGILPARQIGGGGGIRTHEGLRPAGFQDRSHQPLDHPSEVPRGRGFCHHDGDEQPPRGSDASFPSIEGITHANAIPGRATLCGAVSVCVLPRRISPTRRSLTLPDGKKALADYYVRMNMINR